MAFQNQAIENQQQQHLQSQVQYGQASLDSITLGQLKNMVNAPPKPKQQHYDFRYEDEDNLFEEINEFYAFVEADQLGENLRLWQGSFEGAWTELPQAERKAHIVTLLENLEHVDSLVRYSASRRLLYLLQGNFAESTSPEHQMHWIIENSKLVRASQGITIIVDSLKMLSVKHEQLMSISDSDLSRINAAPHLRQSWIEEVLAEISMCLGMLYPIVEVFRSDEEFAEELMGMEPPLPVYFLSLMSNLSNRSARSYPAKKLLLVTWKVLLACLGGMAEQARAKSLARELAGLTSSNDETLNIKSTPVDLQTFREETFVKYPTFSPPQPAVESTGLLSAKLADALNALPVRNHYVHPEANTNDTNGQGNDDPTNANSVLSNGFGTRPGLNHHQQGAAFPGNGPMAATPAPSPPPSPKPKKQQYQTDQTKPFVLPFSVAAPVPRSLVPYAIAEADELYARHMYVSLGLFQTWRTREDFILDESGLREMPGDKEEDARMKRWSVVKVTKGLSTESGNQFEVDDEDEDEKVTWPDSKVLEDAIERAEQDLKALDDQGDDVNKADRKRAKQRRDDLLRIQRVEAIYAATLPFLSGYIVVVLKFLIAINNITSAQANQNQQNQQQQQQPSSGFFLNLGQSLDLPPPPQQQNHSIEEIDALRHREIMIKGLSAFLLLLLKWFKRSHIMKYQHLAFTLLSAGTHVHILRLLTYTEVAAYVVTKNEVPERTFFRYCYEHFSPNAAHVPADQFPILAPRQPSSKIMQNPSASSSNIFSPVNLGPANGGKGEEEIEMITDFSWRNFFAVINVVKIMHKITKANPTRILQLVHHKTSAILKRMMRISHPVLQLQLLKLIKSQVPYSGRKWKQLNMKLITAIYLNCRPELRDEWLATMEVEEAKDSPTNVETFLRRLVAFYDYKRYGYIPPKINSEQHQRSMSLSIADPALSPELPLPNPLASPSASEVFPPLRSQAADPSIFMPFPSEDLAFEEEYEEYLFDLHAGGVHGYGGQSGAGGPVNLDMVSSDRAPSWTELPNDQPIGEGISDSESVVSIGDGLVADFTDGKPVLKEDSEVGKNDWAHMSPKTLGALPKSPAKSPAGGGRRSSSGGGLRPIIPFDLDDSEGSALDEDEDEDGTAEMGPMPIERSTPFAVQDSGRGVDEVEYMYGE